MHVCAIHFQEIIDSVSAVFFFFAHYLRSKKLLSESIYFVSYSLKQDVTHIDVTYRCQHMHLLKFLPVQNKQTLPIQGWVVLSLGKAMIVLLMHSSTRLVTHVFCSDKYLLVGK